MQQRSAMHEPLHVATECLPLIRCGASNHGAVTAQVDAFLPLRCCCAGASTNQRAAVPVARLQHGQHPHRHIIPLLPELTVISGEQQLQATNTPWPRCPRLLLHQPRSSPHLTSPHLTCIQLGLGSDNTMTPTKAALDPSAYFVRRQTVVFWPVSPFSRA